jgi:isocitrate/isopropylmalate dehydrogenase
VTPNLYGTLVANTAAGIAGGTGVMPGGTCFLVFRSLYFNE